MSQSDTLDLLLPHQCNSSLSPTPTERRRGRTGGVSVQMFTFARSERETDGRSLSPSLPHLVFLVSISSSSFHFLLLLLLDIQLLRIHPIRNELKEEEEEGDPLRTISSFFSSQSRFCHHDHPVIMQTKPARGREQYLPLISPIIAVRQERVRRVRHIPNGRAITHTSL